MSCSLFIGRYQPLHQGHIKLIRTVLDEGKKVCVAIKATAIDENNPYSYADRFEMFYKEFSHEIKTKKIEIIHLPDVSEVCHGRNVGWKVREIKLDAETEAISATNIRMAKKDNMNEQGI